MARIRTFKPEFWRHPVISRLPDSVQLMALAVLSMADDEGYFHADPAMVRGEVMPFREDLARISEALAHLSQVGWIELWNHPEQGQMGFVINWCKHQKIDHPSKSKLKTYDIREKLATDSRDTRETLALDQGSGIRDQGSDQGAGSARDEHDIGAQPDAQPPVDEVDRWRYLQNEPWAKALVKAGCKIGPKNWSRWQALAVAHGHERVAAVAETCLATKRWPDETETALNKSGGQTPITQSIQHRIRIIKT